MSTSRDVLWERALSALPDVLLSALRAAELDDPRVLSEYPRGTLTDLETLLEETFGRDGAPLGAASSGQPSSSSCNSATAIPLKSSGTSPGGLVESVLEVGTDPKTGFSLVGIPVGVVGGDPRTGLFVPSGGEVKTDHIPFDVQMVCLVDETVDSPLPGGLATQTAIPDPVSPALDPDLILTLGSELRDEFPGVEQDPEFRDGLPSTEQDPKVRDEFPSIGDLQGRAHSEGLNSTSDIENTAISRISRIAEKSERLRESDFGVQIVPASRSPSELSAHQMGLSLAGTSRLKNEPIDSISTLATEGSAQLSISDRALLRKYKSSDQLQRITRQPETHKEITAVVQRVDGHPPEPPLSLYDRVLLRKYSVPGTAVSPPVSLPVESTKKRRRFHQKGKFSKEVSKEDPRNENSQDQEGSPCGLSSKVAEPPVRAGTIISPSAPSSELAHFTLLYYTLVQDGALPLGSLREFISLETPARRAANRLQTSAAAISDSFASTALSALRRESEHRASIEKSIADRLVIAADVRPKRFRTKWQRAVYDGPTARKDAEASERDRWIQLLANLLRSTDTPMG